jgi:hypothetical protein
MFGLSRKEIENQPTIIHRKDNVLSFMNLSNQRALTKKIYLLHKSNNGLLTYLHFKELVPFRMKSWIYQKDVNKYRQLTAGAIDVLEYLNKVFISDNYDLYSIISRESKYTPLDSNVYRSTVNVSYSIGDESQDILILKKKANELLAEDYRNMDVWAEQTTEVTNKTHRYGNAIPVWQRTMNIRHYDRDNQGYHHADSARASLDTPVYGYGDEMQKLYDALDKQLKKNQTINSD